MRDDGRDALQRPGVPHLLPVGVVVGGFGTLALCGKTAQ